LSGIVFPQDCQAFIDLTTKKESLLSNNGFSLDSIRSPRQPEFLRRECVGFQWRHGSRQEMGVQIMTLMFQALSSTGSSNCDPWFAMPWIEQNQGHFGVFGEP